MNAKSTATADSDSAVDRAIAGAEEMLAQAASSTGEKAAELRGRALEQLRALRESLHDAHHAALEKQFLDVAKAQLEAEIPSNSAADNSSRETVTVIELFRFLHRAILSDGSRNLTTPSGVAKPSRWA